MVMHMFAGETVVIALCRDLTLKLWSCQVSKEEGKNYSPTSTVAFGGLRCENV